MNAPPTAPTSGTQLVKIEDLSLSIGDVPILVGVSFAVGAGRALGIVGESGSGKSMTLRCIARITPPGSRTTGSVAVDGHDVGLLKGAALRSYRRDLGFIFQDPRSAINRMHTIDSFLTERARDDGSDVAQARTRVVDVLHAMGIRNPERRLAQYPEELSGGLLQRVMIASVLAERPSLILADEPTTSLDVTTQSDVLAHTDELRRQQHSAMVFVTHDLDLAIAVCDDIAVLYAGRIVEMASTSSLAATPLHPYTRGLLASRPPLGHRLDSIPVIAGSPTSAAQAGPGCSFVARCPVALDVCRTRFPEEQTFGGTRVHCHRSTQIANGSLDEMLPLRGDAVELEA